jgi:hypothetical protein
LDFQSASVSLAIFAATITSQNRQPLLYRDKRDAGAPVRFQATRLLTCYCVAALGVRVDLKFEIYLKFEIRKNRKLRGIGKVL